MSTPASALPAAAQQRMMRLQAEMGGNPPAAGTNEPPSGNNEPPANNQPPATNQPPASTGEPTGQPAGGNGEGGRVNLSQEEYDELRATANRVQAALAREQDAKDRLEELSHRLTELENSNKAGSNGPGPASGATPAPVVDTSKIVFSDDEQTQYGESRPYIEKVVDLRVAAILNELVPGLRQMVEDAKNTAHTAQNTVQQHQTRTFLQQVQAAVPDMQTLIKHKHWEAFLDEVEPLSGATYDQLLAHNVSKQNLNSVKAVYEAFRTRYVGQHTQQTQQVAAGFAGAATSGGAATPPQQQPGQQKLKLSDRKKASEDYRKGRIKWEELQEVNRRFDAAEKAGNVDYNA